MQKDLKIKISIDKKTGELKVISSEFDELGNKINDADVNTNSLTSSLIGVAKGVVGIYAVNKAFRAVTDSGFAFNMQLEDAKAGLTALSVAVQDKSIPVMERYNIGNKEAIETLRELQRINVETPHTLNQTNQIYKAMYVSMKKAGASTKDMVEITRSLSIASGAAGIEFNSLLAGVDGLASGTVLVNSDLGRFLSSLGLTNQKLKESKNVVKLLEDTLKDFKAADTMKVSLSNLENAWNSLTGEITKTSFEASKKEINSLAGTFNELTHWIHEAGVQWSSVFEVTKSGKLDDLKIKLKDIEDRIKSIKEKQTGFLSGILNQKDIYNDLQARLLEKSELEKTIADLKKKQKNSVKEIHEYKNKISSSEAKKFISNLDYETELEFDKISAKWDYEDKLAEDAKKQKLKDSQDWIKSLKEFYAIDVTKGLNDQKTKEKTKVTFEDWGKTLNSSISNSIVDALQSGDVEGAIQGLGSSIGSSMLQSSTSNLVAGGSQLSAAGGAMSMGGIYGIAAGLGIGAVSKFMDNGTASKTSQQYADEAFNKFISNIEKASKALESFGNVGSSFSTELDTLNKEIQVKQNILNEYNSKPHYIVTKSMRDTVSNDINRLTSRKNEILVNQLGGSIDFSRMNLSDVSKALPANFSLDSYNNALDDINRLALKAKEVGFNNMSEADIQRFTDLTANGSVWQAGKDYADAISLIDDAMKKSVSNIKAYEDSFKTPRQLAEDMAKDLGVTLASSTKGLDNLFNSLKGGVDGLNDAESELLKANKDLIDSNMQSLNNAFLGQYSPLTMSQKTDYANSIASGAIPSNLSSSESSLLALQTAMNSTTDENEATKAFNRYIATNDATEPDSTRTDIVNELRSNRETLNDIVDRLERIEA